jgi:enoyl-CoA hydratase/carnithine racemase
VDATWAERHGLVSAVVAPEDLDAHLATLARMFDQTSRAAVAETKAMLNQRLGELLEAALRREEDVCVRLFDGEDSRVAVAAFVQRRR